MATIKPNTFTSYEFTDGEQRVAAILPDLTKMNFQNKLAEVATQRLNLSVDPVNFNSFIQEEAFLAGQQSILQYFLDESDAAIQAQFSSGHPEE